MSENREEILADFQACTGIEDVAEAIFVLDENNWDLLRAINHVVPPDTQNFQSNAGPDVEMVSEVIDVPASPVETATDMVSIGNNVGHSRTRAVHSLPVLNNHVDRVNSQPSTSNFNNQLAKMLRFNVQYNDRIIPIEIPDTGTIADIKLKLFNELKLAPCKQILSGVGKFPLQENLPLSKLKLSSDNAIFLTTKNSESGFTMDEEQDVTERLKATYTLKILDLKNNRPYNLKYPGTKTVLEVKGDVFTLTSINVRHQVWSGWPPNIDDHTILALSGINYPEHELTVQQNPSATENRTRASKKQSNTGVITVDSDDDEFEDASETFNLDDYFIDNETSKRIEPLIPEDVEDEIVGCITFSEQFTNRYGPVHPSFYQGTLEDALKEACNKPAKDRKLLGIYLHHDSSVLSNVFCTQLLGSESVMQIIENNFVFWGWDLTFQNNRNKLQNSVNKIFGPMANQNFMHSLWNIPTHKLPAIVIITKVRSSIDIFNIVYGNVGVNELLSSLVEAVEVFTEHQRVEIREEQERAERELVKWEQDQAYRESLEADRAKEEAKRQQAEAESQERIRRETEKAEEEARKEAYRKEVEANLPSEPKEGDITKIRFRLPNGQNLERRFLATTPLKVLLDFLIVEGYPTQEYKVISSWPRRDLTSLDSSKTLEELKLYPQETVILEER